jgi:hypothetical protein
VVRAVREVGWVSLEGRGRSEGGTRSRCGTIGNGCGSRTRCKKSCAGWTTKRRGSAGAAAGIISIVSTPPPRVRTEKRAGGGLKLREKGRIDPAPAAATATTSGRRQCGPAAPPRTQSADPGPCEGTVSRGRGSRDHQHRQYTAAASEDGEASRRGVGRSETGVVRGRGAKSRARVGRPSDEVRCALRLLSPLPAERRGG